MSRTSSPDVSSEVHATVERNGLLDDPDAWTDPRPSCRYEIRYLPTVVGDEHDRRLFEWVFEWLDCEDVAAVDVDHGPDEEAGPVTVVVETITPCSRAGSTDEHERVIEKLSVFGTLAETDCQSIEESGQ